MRIVLLVNITLSLLWIKLFLM